MAALGEFTSVLGRPIVSGDHWATEPVRNRQLAGERSRGMDEQKRVAAFLETHDLETDPEFRVLDLAAEVGEVAADTVKSSAYGTEPDAMAVSEDELGDVLFALLATAEAFDVDAGRALDRSLRKYERRIEESGDAGST